MTEFASGWTVFAAYEYRPWWGLGFYTRRGEAGMFVFDHEPYMVDYLKYHVGKSKRVTGFRVERAAGAASPGQSQRAKLASGQFDPEAFAEWLASLPERVPDPLYGEDERPTMLAVFDVVYQEGLRRGMEPHWSE